MNIYVIDLETANYDPVQDNFSTENCMICEIGIVGLDTKTGRIEKVFNKTCREEQICHPDSWIFQNTTLTFNKVSGAEPISSFRDELQHILDRGIPVTSWGHDFDLSHLENTTRNFTIPMKFWDPKKVLADLLKIPGSYGYKWPKVHEAYNFFHATQPFYEAHRALDDAKVEAEIIYQAIRKWPILEEKWASFV